MNQSSLMNTDEFKTGLLAPQYIELLSFFFPTNDAPNLLCSQLSALLKSWNFIAPISKSVD